MARSQNIFHNLVTDENSITELLCNLMRFAAFRRPLLAHFFPGSSCADRIEFGEIDTQINLTGSGRPDLIIDNDEVYALVEVKVEKSRGLTNHQPESYFDRLLKERMEERWLVFVVPEDWVDQQVLDDSLDRLKKKHKEACIQTRVVSWKDILAIIEKHDLQNLNPFFGEFHQVLTARYKPAPIDFSKKELLMLFKKEMPEALSKLNTVINQVREMSSAYVTRQTVERALWPEEYGFYFRGNGGEDVLWFGMWSPFWEKEECPLCFGVDNDWSPAAKQTFVGSYKGKPTQFDGFTLGRVSQETLASENAAAEIWEQLEPVLKAIGAVRS